MLMSMIQVKVKKYKRDELMNTLKALAKRFTRAKGCISFQFIQDLENENLFQLIGEWRSQEDYDRHVNSPEYEVLQGAIQVLGFRPEVRILKIDEDVTDR